MTNGYEIHANNIKNVEGRHKQFFLLLSVIANRKKKKKMMKYVI